MTGPYLGVDIGGTNARVALVEPGGRVLSSARAALSDRSLTGVVTAIRGLVDTLGEKPPPKVGVAFAAMLRNGRVANAPNLGWLDVDLAGPLGRALDAQVRMVNDLSAAAWGERCCGAARGCDEVLTVFVGTGVGSAVISGGRLLTGEAGLAGELGHTKVVPENGRPCGCGQWGCLEAYVGGARLGAWMKEVGLSGHVGDLERLALAGDARAKELYDFGVGQLALAVANQVTMLNPRMVVLGGGVLSRNPGMVERIRDGIGRYATPAARAGLRVELASLGDDSGVVGAALLQV